MAETSSTPTAETSNPAPHGNSTPSAPPVSSSSSLLRDTSNAAFSADSAQEGVHNRLNTQQSPGYTHVYPLNESISTQSRRTTATLPQTSPPASTSTATPAQQRETSNPGIMECNICLESAQEPVITYCGHVFCWPCIYTWMEQSGNHTCPVCKAGCSKEKLIPIYGRGQEQKDPRTNIPNRPSAQRPDPPRQNQHQQQQYHQPFAPMFGGPFMHHSFAGGQIHFSAGLFPNIFGMNFQGGNGPEGPDAAQQAAISKILFFFGTIVLFILLLF